MLDVHQALKEISKLGYMKILVEGGAKLSSTLLKYNLINELHWFRASKILGAMAWQPFPVWVFLRLKI